MNIIDKEFDILKLIMNPTLLPRIKPYLEPEIMFYKTAFRALAKVIKTDEHVNGRVPGEIVQYLQQTHGDSLGQADFSAIKSVIESKELEIDSEKTALAVVEKFMKRRLLDRAMQVHASRIVNHEEEALKLYRAAEKVNLASFSSFREVNSYSDLEIIRREDFPDDGRVFPSSVGIINSKLTMQGYKYGDLVMVCAPPKVGKSTFMIQEACKTLTNGGNVLHLAIGDMTSSDVYTKYITCLHPTATLSEVTRNSKPYYEEVKDCIKRVHVRESPALSLSIDEVVNSVKAKKNEFDFDVVVVDYDANIASPRESMYEAGGVVYASLKGMAQECKCVVFVGSQPKHGAWEKEPLDAGDAAESSRKQHTVDVMITLAKNKTVPGVGTLALPLVRRGESNCSTRICFDYFAGKIFPIMDLDYNKVRNDEITLADIRHGVCPPDNASSSQMAEIEGASMEKIITEEEELEW